MKYRFGDFMLDSGTRRLLCGEEECRLSPKAFELLLELVANSSRALSKSDLHQHLWPSTFVVDTNLAGLIAEVRQALGDSADEPRFVRTMHRFGYWFIAPVTRDGVEEQTASGVRYWLFWESRQVALGGGDNLIGRAREAEVWIDATGVSRHHARIRIEGERATIEDLGSKNGTFVGGRQITAPTPLADGDQIRLGSMVLTFRIPPPPSSTDTLPKGV
ncbi:MAG TPA: FHA domain-containing protein [Vicinamibacterales bacterium]